MKNTALITGASSGIGKELAIVHAQHGGDLVLLARREERLQALKQELEEVYNIQVKILVKDLTEESAPEEIYRELQSAGIEVNYLINNAGLGRVAPFAQQDWLHSKQMLDLNITALVHLTHLFLPDMIKRGNGKILNVSSVAAFMPGPLQAVYFATKAFVLHFSEAIAEELKGTGVSVTALCPGATDTEFTEVANAEGINLFKTIVHSARYVAEKGYAALINDRRVCVPGIINKMLAYIAVRFSPRIATVKVTKLLMKK